MPIFGTNFGWEYLTIDNSAIEAFCYTEQEQSSAPLKVFGWQSGFIDINTPALGSLVRAINLKLNEITCLYNIKQEHAPVLTNAWININKPTGGVLGNNVPHLHPGKFASFVYYVKAEENCGTLTLVSPLHDMLEFAIPHQVYESRDEHNSTTWVITPKPGTLVTFPAWLRHQANPNHSSSDRISIAFNAELKGLQTILNPKE
jgi:uncharacterized protein (TIGR02466 family)